MLPEAPKRRSHDPLSASAARSNAGRYVEVEAGAAEEEDPHGGEDAADVQDIAAAERVRAEARGYVPRSAAECSSAFFSISTPVFYTT